MGVPLGIELMGASRMLTPFNYHRIVTTIIKEQIYDCCYFHNRMDSGSTEKTPSKRSRQLPNIDAVRHMLKARRKLVFKADVRPTEKTMQQ